MNERALEREELHIFVVAFSLLFFETALFHVLKFTSTYLAATSTIGAAVLGLGCGSLATYLFDPLRKQPFPKLLLCLIVSMFAAALNVVLAPDYVFFSPLLILPFAIGNISITTLFLRNNSHKMYTFDLCGATAGVFFAIVAIPLMMSENAVIATLALLALLAFSLSKEKYLRALFLIIFFSSCLFVTYNVNTEDFVLEKIVRGKYTDWPHKVFWLLDHPELEYVLARDNLVSRISVIARKGNKDYKTVCFDGIGNDTITRDGLLRWVNDKRIPFMMSQGKNHRRVFDQNPNILIIGTGAQGVVKPLIWLSRDARLIDAVEINPAIVEIMEGPCYEASGRAFLGLSPKVIDARTYLRETTKKYDLITMLNTYKAQKSCGIFGEPDFIHTYEAFETYLAHLNDNGYILLEERDITDQAHIAIFRIINTIFQVLKNNGAKNPQDHFFITNTWTSVDKPRRAKYSIIVVKKSPINERERKFFRDWCDFQQERETGEVTELGYLTGVKMESEYTSFLQAKESAQAKHFGENVTITPPCDDNPFLFDVYLDRKELKTILLRTALACLSLLILSLIALFKKVKVKAKTVLPYAFYFGLIGMGYFIIEIGLLHFYQIHMGSPTNSFIFILGALLFASGLGSQLTKGKEDKVVIYAIVAIALLSLYHLLCRDFAVSLTGDQPFLCNIAVALTVIPLGMAMGVPLPFGLEKAKNNVADTSPAAFLAINAAAGTFASILTLYLSVAFGFSLTFALAIILYILALAIYWLL